MLCVGLGYPLAYWLSRKPPRQQRIAALFVLLPFWTSALIKNFSWLVLLGRNGIMAKIMAAIGMKGGDQLLFSRTTVVFAMVHTLLPLAVVTMLPVMNQIDRRLTMAASTLGANSARAFWQVFFPLSMRGVAAAGLLVLVASLGFFITPALVGGAEGHDDRPVDHPADQRAAELAARQCAGRNPAESPAIATCFAYDRIFGLSSVATGGGPDRRDRMARVRRAGLAIIGLGGSDLRAARGDLETQCSRSSRRCTALGLCLDADRNPAGSDHRLRSDGVYRLVPFCLFRRQA